MRQEEIEILREIINTKDVSIESQHTPFFGGADISIVTILPEKKETFLGEPQYVVTKNAKELSWLIYKLKEMFSEDLDYLNKYPFYGRLAERANNSIQLNNDNLKTLLLDVLDEAIKMNDEINGKLHT